MRIGLVATIPHPTSGGASTFLKSVLDALSTHGTKHTFVHIDISQSPSASVSTHSRIRALRHAAPAWIRNSLAYAARKLAGKPNWLASIEAKIRDNDIDIVWFVAPPGAVVSVPFITTVWDLEHRNKPYFPEVSVTGWDWQARDQAYATVLPRASMIITGTLAGKREIVHYYRVNPDNVTVIPFPVPDIQTGVMAAASKKYRGSRDYLIYPAQFWPHKNHANLLLALSILKQKHGLELDVVFTGSDKGNSAYIRTMIDDLGLCDQVKILGFVPREDLELLYRDALALVFPTFFGPDNIPPLEAFALGCPVVASRVSGAEEQLGEAALLFDPAEPQSIADAIYVISCDSELRARLILNGRTVASERSPQAYAARINDTLDRFVAVRRCWGREYEHS